MVMFLAQMEIVPSAPQIWSTVWLLPPRAWPTFKTTLKQSWWSYLRGGGGEGWRSLHKSAQILNQKQQLLPSSGCRPVCSLAPSLPVSLWHGAAWARSLLIHQSAWINVPENSLVAVHHSDQTWLLHLLIKEVYFSKMIRRENKSPAEQAKYEL